MLRDSFEHAREDMHARALHEHRIDAQRLIDATKAGLRGDGALLSSQEFSSIEEKIKTLEQVLNTADPRAIKVASDALNRATEEFAARRMNASVRSALAGKRVASFDA
jgi:molecular chaperone HscA